MHCGNFSEWNDKAEEDRTNQQFTVKNLGGGEAVWQRRGFSCLGLASFNTTWLASFHLSDFRSSDILPKMY